MGLQRNYILASNALIASSSASGGGGYDGGSLIPTENLQADLGSDEKKFRECYVYSLRGSYITTHSIVSAEARIEQVWGVTALETGSRDDEDIYMTDGQVFIHTFNVCNGRSYSPCGGVILFDLDKRLQLPYSNHSWQMYTIWSDDSADDEFVIHYHESSTATQNERTAFYFTRGGGLDLHSNYNTCVRLRQNALWSESTREFSLGTTTYPIDALYLSKLSRVDDTPKYPVGETVLIAVKLNIQASAGYPTIYVHSGVIFNAVSTPSSVSNYNTSGVSFNAYIHAVTLISNLSVASGTYTFNPQYKVDDFSDHLLTGNYMVITECLFDVDLQSQTIAGICLARRIS